MYVIQDNTPKFEIGNLCSFVSKLDTLDGVSFEEHDALVNPKQDKAWIAVLGLSYKCHTSN